MVGVLIVEDEQIFALDLQQTLGELGYDAYGIAASADEAMQWVERRRPDLVLMDIRIQGDIDGIETASLVHARYDVPIVFLSAHADAVTLSRAQAEQPFGYVIKPVQPNALKVAIEIALRCHGELADARARERRLASAATHDELTGLCNRRGLVEQAQRIQAVANRTKRPFALAYMDVNGMKAINDTLGHAAGDQALIAMATLIRATFRQGDLLARLGGDEFVAIAVDYAELDGGKALLRRFDDQLAQAHSQVTAFRLSASIGVIVYDPSEPVAFEQLLVAADARMYEAKVRRRIQGSQRVPLII